MNPLPDWAEFFSPNFDPEALGELGEMTEKTYARVATASKAFIESFDVPVGLTPREEVWALNKVKLYRYTPVKPAEERHPIPVLLVYALINKPFVFDLIPGRSFIEFMVEQGFDMYLLDWGSPGPEDKDTTMDDYVTEYLRRAVRKMLRIARADEFTLLGYCIGATLATTYAALYPEAPIRNLILLTAPLDFGKGEGVIATWASENALDVEKLVNTFGNIPGEMIKAWAKIIRPVENMMGVYITMFRLMDDANALWGWQAMHRWVEEVIPFAGAAFRQFVEVYIRQNKLIKGEHVIRGRPVDLKHIRAAFLNIVAEYDHLIPRSASETIMEKVSSTDKEFRVIPAPHVGIMISRSSRYKLWPEIAEWLGKRSETIAQPKQL
ncbi:MAG: alpha/beta fold hydrolase [Anaerolineales bacterium]|nr:alpha/beta fold hydrolase [Anaerolineales bacterium]